MGHFDVNVKISEDAPGFVSSLNPARQEKLKREFQTRLRDKSFTEADFNDATMCTARDADAARHFFEKVYTFAFEDGDEPDVAEYWKR